MGKNEACKENHNIENMNNMSEMELFFRIENLEMSIWYNIEYVYPFSSQAEIDEFLSDEYNELDYLMLQTKRFGVKFPEFKPGTHVEKNEYYNAWYKFNQNHFYTVLTDDEYTDATVYGPNDSIPLPTGSWQDLLPSELQTDAEPYTLKKKKTI